jgi:hypothetical protein
VFLGGGGNDVLAAKISEKRERKRGKRRGEAVPLYLSSSSGGRTSLA